MKINSVCSLPCCPNISQLVVALLDEMPWQLVPWYVRASDTLPDNTRHLPYYVHEA